jgi:hypothetical protein
VTFHQKFNFFSEQINEIISTKEPNKRKATHCGDTMKISEYIFDKKKEQ